MSGPVASALAWRRWVRGSTVLTFLFLIGALWTACLVAWQLGFGLVSVSLLATSAFGPPAWLAIRLRRRPLWALPVRGDQAEVVKSLREALLDRTPTPLSPADGPEGLFRRCETLLRIDDPSAWVGLLRSAADSGTTILLLPRSSDRKSVDALRQAIVASLPSGRAEQTFSGPLR